MPEFTEIALEEGLAYFEDPISQEILTGIEAVTQSGLRSLHQIARFGNSESDLTSGVYFVGKPGEGLTGFLMLVATMEYPRDFGLLTTVDYQPVQVSLNGTPQTLPVIHMEPGSRKIYRFSLPPLSEGLHTLIVTFISEPELNFWDFGNPGGLDEFEMAAWQWRDAAFEFGLLIWVTSQPPDKPADWPLEARSFAPEETAFITSITMLKDKPLPGESQWVFYKDTVRAGEQVTYYLQFSAFDRGSGEIPVKVMVFWDDLLTQVDEIVVPVEVAIEGDYIPYTIWVPSTLEDGEHKMTVIGFPYPYYLHWWQDGSEWRANVGYYSHLITRVSIIVEEESK